MADYFETGFFGGNQSAWHGLGTVIPQDVVTASEALHLSGLDWEVIKLPVRIALPSGNEKVMENFMATVRSSDEKELGVVGKDYTIVQNAEAFAFMDNLLASNDAKYHTAGSLKDGRQVWMLARVNRDILIGGEESERIAPFILLSNGHDGGSGLQVAVTPIRVVCWNTLSAALNGAQRTWSTRHTSGITDRIAMAEDAAETLGLTYKFFDRLEAFGNAMITQPYSNREMEKFLKQLVPYSPKDQADLGGRSAKNKDQAREAIQAIFANEDNLANVRNTKWAAYQAVTQYDDHVKKIRVKDDDGNVSIERRFERAVLNPWLKTEAVRILAPEFAAKKPKGRGDLATV